MYARLCQLNQQMILAAGLLDVNPTAMLLLQPLFLVLSPVGGSAAAHPNQSSFPLLSICDSTAAFSHLRVIPVRGLAVVHRLAMFGAAWSTNKSHQKRIVCESLTAGTHEVYGRTQRKFLLIKLFPPPDSWDPLAISSHGRKCPLVMRKNHSSR